MKILAYQISGQTVGIDIDHWLVDDLNGNEPFTIIQDVDPIPSGYTDISSITSWGNWGEEIHPDVDRMVIRKEIKNFLTPEQQTGNTTGLTEQELEIIQEYKLDDYYLLYDYYERIPDDIDCSEPPFDLNYDILGLHKKKYFVKGELKKIEYYGEYDFYTDNYQNLLVHEDRTYYRINEMVYRREMDICWHLNNGLSGATKHTTKYYTQEESIMAGERRRRNIISSLKISLVGLIMQTSGVTQTEAQNLGFGFLTEYADAIDVYIEGALQFLYDAVLNDTNHSWLDNEIANTGGLTVRQYLYSELQLDYTINNTYV